MKQLPPILLAAGLALIHFPPHPQPFSHSGESGEPKGQPPSRAGGIELGQQVKGILQTHCAGCHGGGKAAKGGFGFVLDRDLLVSRQLLVPGQARESDLFQRIRQGEMPPPKQKLRPSPAEVKVLENWINAGAPAFDRSFQGSKTLTPTEATEAILADLQSLDPRRRRFSRYLTITHLALAGRPEKDLQTTREATAKLLNSLSWHPRIGLPEPVDPDGTILRIDLRAYKWTAAIWEKLVAAYPYRLQTASEADALAKVSGSDVPALRADWFVATASRPPLYHDILQLPTGDRALERQLQVDVLADIQDDSIQRAGFNDSGVSKNNRLIERHDAAHGAFWRSYDFSSNSGRQNLFENPVGPNAGAISFKSAGGEMIYHLPNGLQAYMLVDGIGRRIDKAPPEIVADPRRPDQRVVTGLSCMSCHARGLILKTDQLRAHVRKNGQIFGQAIVDTVTATHPTKSKFQAQIDDDNVRYLKALEKFGVRDPDQEPVNLVAQRFEATLDGKAAAAELGLTPEEFAGSVGLFKQNPSLARIHGSLLVQGGTVQRDVFQENFPEMARLVLAAQAIQAAKTKLVGDIAFQGHTGTVNCIAFTGDGRRAASGSDDRSIRIWEVPSGKRLNTIEINSEITALAFSPDGNHLLIGGRDRLVRLWDLRTNKPGFVLRGHTDAVRAVAFAPNGKLAASGGDDRAVRIWDLGSGEEITDLAGHTQSVTSVAWSRDGEHVLSGSRDGTLRWWNWESRKKVFVMEGHAGAVLSVAVAPNGTTAISGGNDKTVRHWSLVDGKEIFCFKGHENAVVRVQFHTGSREISSSSSQHQGAEPSWRRWDVQNRKEIGTRSVGEEHRFGCAAFSPDGRYRIVGGPGGFLRLWSW